jgi:hypothetical protein
MVGVPAARQHGVQLLSRLLPGQQAVHGVGRDALRRMDGGGVTETGRGAHIVKRQPDSQQAVSVPDGETTTVVEVGDGPPVAVLDPVGGR